MANYEKIDASFYRKYMRIVGALMILIVIAHCIKMVHVDQPPVRYRVEIKYGNDGPIIKTITLTEPKE